MSSGRTPMPTCRPGWWCRDLCCKRRFTLTWAWMSWHPHLDRIFDSAMDLFLHGLGDPLGTARKRGDGIWCARNRATWGGSSPSANREARPGRRRGAGPGGEHVPDHVRLNGQGLAAPQVGFSRRVAVDDVPPGKKPLTRSSIPASSRPGGRLHGVPKAASAFRAYGESWPARSM